NIPAFNAAQYRVEHCAESEHIVVKASAGTGKTTVMIDRILYLMHMVPGLQMSDIYMITFTNEATNQMNRRLQEVLFKKYALTKNKRYLNWLE
ncbi:UvrD-helicase domain-containing protein, partial [Proteus mirabilis]|uniref:UvrD-helicase domain-containing protein n=1 Tax=Proteus mirabilis TaxID=584 RepID=UPI00162590A2